MDANGLEEEIRLSCIPPPLPPEMDLPPLPASDSRILLPDNDEDVLWAVGQFHAPPSDYVLTPRSKGREARIVASIRFLLCLVVTLTFQS